MVPEVTPSMRAVHAAGRAVAEERVVLGDGAVIMIRPLVTGDISAVAAWFEGLGPTARRDRFLSFIDRLDGRTLSRLAAVDHREHEALTAMTAEGATVGIARYIRLPGTPTAELAVAVIDRWAGRGIASLLLQRIVERARAAGIDRLIVLCLFSNQVLLHLLNKLGPTSVIGRPDDAGAVEMQIDLAG